MTVPAIVTNILAVLSEVAEWFVGAVESATAMFWDSEQGLTVIGALGVIGLGIAVILLVLRLIGNYLRLGQ